MRHALHRLATRISLISVLHMASMLAMIFLVSWATFDPAANSTWMQHGEFDVVSVVNALDQPDVWKPQAKRLANIGVRFAVYGADGRLVASNTTTALAPLSRAEAQEVSEEMHAVERGSRPTFARTSRLPSGESCHVLFAPPPFVPPFRHLLLGFALALVASATGAVLLARSFSRPLTQLTAAAKRLGSGDLNARAELSRGDEFGELSRAFDDMAGQLGVLVRAQQELLANVSHELRTPLARIRAALDFASESDGQALQLAMRDFNEDVSELERLVSDVLQTARLDVAAGRVGLHLPVLRPEPFELSDLLDRAEARFLANHPERKLDIRSDASLPALVGDAVLLRRALDNLIDNAQSYSEPSTAIAVTACREHDELHMSVTDRGIGIAPADLSRVTEPFFRTDRSRARRTGGLGLGLSLTRRIVEAHGGTLSVESRLGLGTSVHLRLPLEAAPRLDA